MSCSRRGPWTRRRLRPLVLAAVATGLLWPGTALADEVYAPADGGVSHELAADGGRLVYVGSREGAPKRLFEGFGPGARPLGALVAAENAAITDLSLGTDARGRPVAAFAYCRGGEACQLHRYDFATGRDRLMLASRKGCDLSGPRMQRGVLYFRRPGRRPRRGRAGCRSGIFQKHPGRRARRLTMGAYYDFDVAGGLLAFVRQRVLRRGNPSDGVPSSSVDEVRLLRFGHRRSRRVAAGRNSSNPRYEAYGGVFLDEVALDGGRVYWKRRDEGSLRGDELTVDLVRASIHRPAVKTTLSGEGRQPPPSGVGGAFPAESYAVDGDDIYYYSVPYVTRGAITHVTPAPPRFER